VADSLKILLREIAPQDKVTEAHDACVDIFGYESEDIPKQLKNGGSP